MRYLPFINLLAVLALCFFLFAGAGSDMDFWSLSSNYADIPDDFGALMDSIVTMEQDKDNRITNEITYDSTETRFERYDGSGYDLLDQAEIGSTSEVTVEIFCSAEARITAYPAAALVVNEGGIDRDFRVEGVSAANALFIQGSDGKVGIGTASPLELLEVNSSTADAGIRVESGSGQNAYLRLAGNDGANNVWQLRATAGTVFELARWTGATYTGYMTVKSDGKVGIGTATPGEILEVNGTIECVHVTETSDTRCKENIVDVEGTSTEKIKALKARAWDWKDSDKGSTIGFVAQELEQVIPEAVVTHPEMIDEETGETIKDERKAIVPTVILTHLVKTVQELEARISELEK